MAAKKDTSKLNAALLEGQPPSADEHAAVKAFYKEERMAMISMGWPMLVSFFCRMGMASTDSAFVGHISDNVHTPAEYLAAAGLADMVTNILIIPPLAFNMSLNALVSQAVGSGNKKMAGIWLQLSVFWLTIAYIPCLSSFFYVKEMLSVLGFSPTICELAGLYAKFNIFWPIPNGWYQCMRFYFQALPQIGTLILQAAIGQTTTLLIAQLGDLAIAASSAATALTQIFTGGLSATLGAVAGVRVGFHLGKGDWKSADRAAIMIMRYSAISTGVIAAILIPFRRQAMSIMTIDDKVIDASSALLAPVLLNTFGLLVVGCITGGVFTSQGRTQLATFLSMGFELPPSLGTVGFLVVVIHASLPSVYWAHEGSSRCR